MILEQALAIIMPVSWNVLLVHCRSLHKNYTLQLRCWVENQILSLDH